jgi:uncharacterized membrane protein
MKTIARIGILLIVLGGFVLAYHGFTYNHPENVVDIGSFHATVERHHRYPIPPILGGLALVGGIVLLVAGVKRNS